MKCLVISAIVAMTSLVNVVAGNFTGQFAYNTETRENRVETQTVRYEPHHSLNFFYTDDVTVEYASWNGKENGYTDVKQKTVYRQTDANSLQYLSYEWSEKNNDWSLTAEHLFADGAVQLLAEK